MAKQALLDTDFILKTFLIKADNNSRLIDLVVNLPGYKFVCHSQIDTEVSRHNAAAFKWLKNQIKSNKITEYSDHRILCDMSSLYKKSAVMQYHYFLNSACGAFGRNYFEEHFMPLDSSVGINTTIKDYLSGLKAAETAIGQGKSLGEIKTYVLLQWLNVSAESNTYYFCSDDRKARNGIYALRINNNIRCVSLISLFNKLKKEFAFDAASLSPYIASALSFFTNHKQTDMRVQDAQKSVNYIKIPCSQVFADILDDKFTELENGDLKYKKV